MRSATLALAKPPPIGVEIGPLSATWFFTMELMTSSGTGVPYLVIDFRAGFHALPVDLDARRLDNLAPPPPTLPARCRRRE